MFNPMYFFLALGIKMVSKRTYKRLETQIPEKPAWKITQCLLSTEFSFPCPREANIIWEKRKVTVLNFSVLGSVTRQYLTMDAFTYCISKKTLTYTTSVLHTKEQFSLGFYLFWYETCSQTQLSQSNLARLSFISLVLFPLATSEWWSLIRNSRTSRENLTTKRTLILERDWEVNLMRTQYCQIQLTKRKMTQNHIRWQRHEEEKIDNLF